MSPTILDSICGRWWSSTWIWEGMSISLVSGSRELHPPLFGEWHLPQTEGQVLCREVCLGIEVWISSSLSCWCLYQIIGRWPSTLRVLPPSSSPPRCSTPRHSVGWGRTPLPVRQYKFWAGGWGNVFSLGSYIY